MKETKLRKRKQKINSTGEPNRLCYGRQQIVLQFDDTKLLSTAMDGSISVWQLPNKKEAEARVLYRFSGYTAYIRSLQFDEFKLISDGTNNVIHMTNRKMTKEIHKTTQIFCSFTASTERKKKKKRNKQTTEENYWGSF
jgi:WD40 repeat protein